MYYYSLKAIVASQKEPIALRSSSESFYLTPERVEPYIEPTFTKEEYPTEKPAILLVSAVGASGKSTTANALAFDTGLPILDLAKHKPVGDNSLTGILTSAYPIESVGPVLEGLRNGTHGVVIDGIDEGRSKTTEQGFEAFLDDLIERSNGAKTTTIVVLGRSQVLLSTWLYLAEKGADVGLVRIDPFNLEQAKNYIDAYVKQQNANQQAQYEQARDGVLDKLGAAFASTEISEDAFLSFIGYPPVLDAIATLLRTEPNYHRIYQALGDAADGELEVKLLIRIADFLLTRERDDKALPNFINEIASNAHAAFANQLIETLYNEDEQCARVLARALGDGFPRQVVSDVALNEKYEAALATWCPDHPFLDGSRIRNAVFESVAVARCILTDVPEYQALAVQYTSVYKPTYHVLYIMAQLAASAEISARFFNILIQSCSDFMSKGREIEIEVNGLAWDEHDLQAMSSADLEISISVQSANQINQIKAFKFKGIVFQSDLVPLGPLLTNATVTLPCDILLEGVPALECAGSCRIVARKIQFDTPDLVVRGVSRSSHAAGSHESGLFLDVEQALGLASNVTIKGGTVEIACIEHGLAYPLAKYVQKTEKAFTNPDLEAKFLRLRRILLEFASHSKGGLAKYRDKIEHERVLRGQSGQNVLAQLLSEGILYKDTKFYYVQSEKLSLVLGVTWHELRQHKSSRSLEEFLKRVR